VKRLTEDGVVLDARIWVTSAAAKPQSALLASMLPHTGRHTLVAKSDGQQVAGQFYLTSESRAARMVYLAPRPEEQLDSSAWLLVLDGMTREAGRLGAYMLTGEVEEGSALFVLMRRAGFAVYSRQQIWVHLPGTPLPAEPIPVTLTPATDTDRAGVLGLYRRVVPNLIQHVGWPPAENGFVYRENGQVVAYIDVAEGRDGVFFVPYVDPSVLHKVGALIAAAASQVPKLDRRPLAVCVARYQGGLILPLELGGFERVADQALMVRHITSRIQVPQTAPALRWIEDGQRKRERVPELCLELFPPKDEPMP